MDEIRLALLDALEDLRAIVAVEVPHPFEEVPVEPLLAAFGKVGPAFPPLPQKAPHRSRDANPPREIEENRSVRAFEASVSRVDEVPVDDPAIARHNLVEVAAELIP